MFYGIDSSFDGCPESLPAYGVASDGLAKGVSFVNEGTCLY
jgi:hypothetical protein